MNFVRGGFQKHLFVCNIMKKFMNGVAKIRRGVGEFRKRGAEILWRGLLKGVADFCGGGCRILWREFKNFLKGTVSKERLFSDLFSG